MELGRYIVEVSKETISLFVLLLKITQSNLTSFL